MIVLRLEHTQTAVQRQMMAFIAKARSTTQVSKDYLPPKAPAAPAKTPAKNGG